MELIRAKEELDANRIILDFPEAGIQVLNGRYGPYITDRAKNAKIPKDREPKTLTLEECKELIAAAPVRRGRFGAKKSPAKSSPAKAEPVAAAAKQAAPKKKTTKASGKKAAGKAAKTAAAAKPAKSTKKVASK
jgi:DNA topoisomerase-1